jgi:hypothetical protein
MFNLNQFQQAGFQVCRNVLSASEIADLQAFLNLAMHKSCEYLLHELNLTQTSDLIDFMAICEQEPSKFESLPSATRSILVGHFELETRLNPSLWVIPRSKGIQSLLNDVFSQQKVFMHMPPTARFVLPGNRWAGVPAHQDLSYNRHMQDFVTIWVPLVEIDKSCGGVVVHKGSGQLSEQPQISQSKLFWQSAVADLGYEKFQPDMNPGDVLLLNRWVVHESAPNHSQQTRLSIDCRFFTGSSAKHALDLQTWQVLEPQA